ncbi:MAG: hypothetical protein QOJ32_579 [Frankiaceae bacterium]|nr:hypothetical protein [Frankiaceae bacterium]
MQTFLPYADFTASSVVLDDRRLGKQRVETFQILRALTWPEYAWKNHPAVRMWRGFIPALVAYGLANCGEWVRRGNADTVENSLLVFTDGRRPDPAELAVAGQLPPWVGLPLLHLSHRSALVRKQPEFYRPLFGDVPDDLPYLWPSAAFPRWPVRRPARTGLAGALAALGFDEPRPGQLEVVEAVTHGRDVLACFAPGAGATATGLLAGLALETDQAGSTLWLGADPGGGGLLPDDGVVEPAPRERAGDPGEPVTAAGPGPVARPPSDADVLAMREEADAVPDFRFHRAADLNEPAVATDLRSHPPALVVVESPAGQPAADGVRLLRADLADRGLRPPVLVLAAAADTAQRDELCRAYGLVEPTRAGGGFHPAGLLLGVARVRDENRRRDLVADLLVRTNHPGLVVGGNDEATRRLTRGLLTRGARIAALPSPARRTARASAISQWRRGGLRALVVGAESVPGLDGLGRRGPAFALLAGAQTTRDRRALLDLLHQLPGRSGPVPDVLVVTDDAADNDDAAQLFPADCCRWANLLDVVGEPVAVPCGRCDVCRGVADDPVALLADS